VGNLGFLIVAALGAFVLALPCHAERSSAVVVPRWRVGAPVLRPGPKGNFDETAVKDPSVVRFDGQWHVFYTACGRDAHMIGYVAADALESLDAAPRFALTRLRSAREVYAAAPQVFLFAPTQTWYLVYQTRDSNYQPVYSTTKDLRDPESWSPPEPLVAKHEDAKWIDFWVIADDSRVFLFYTRNHGDLYAMTTSLGDFPRGFSRPKKVFSPVHEAVHIYRASGKDEYHMLFERRTYEDLRRFGLATAPRLEGPWIEVTDRFAAVEQLDYPAGVERWTDEVSHGELLRTGHDQRLEYDPASVRFLIQGMRRGEHRGPYVELVWILGVIEKEEVP